MINQKKENILGESTTYSPIIGRNYARLIIDRLVSDKECSYRERAAHAQKALEPMDGKEYMEKIVQVGFEMPRVERSQSRRFSCLFTHVECQWRKTEFSRQYSSSH